MRLKWYLEENLYPQSDCVRQGKNDKINNWMSYSEKLEKEQDKVEESRRKDDFNK